MQIKTNYQEYPQIYLDINQKILPCVLGILEVVLQVYLTFL
jgi:hypothetical protein